MSPRELGAEFIGTFTLVTAVCGAALFSAPSAGLVAVAFAVGLSVMAMAFAVGPISGGHFNPAVTLGMVAGGPLRGRARHPAISSRRCSAARRRPACSTSSSAVRLAGSGTTSPPSPISMAAPTLFACRGRPDRDRHDGAVPDRHHGRDDEELPGRLRADRDRPVPHRHPPRRDPSVERIGRIRRARPRPRSSAARRPGVRCGCSGSHRSSVV